MNILIKHAIGEASLYHLEGAYKVRLTTPTKDKTGDLCMEILSGGKDVVTLYSGTPENVLVAFNLVTEMMAEAANDGKLLVVNTEVLKIRVSHNLRG
jgi:hypothetical protein